MVVARTSYPAVRKVLPTRLAAPFTEVALATTVLTLEGGTDAGVVVPGGGVVGVNVEPEPVALGPVELVGAAGLDEAAGETPGAGE